MLIAGHETTAAVLTWAVFLLAQVWFLVQTFGQYISLFLAILMCGILVKMQNPSKITKAQVEVDSVLGQERPTFESIKKLE